MTDQEILETVCEHAVKQNEKATIGHDCRYRVEKDGRILKCFIGCLIKDEDYDPEMEDKVWFLDIIKDALKKNDIEIVDFTHADYQKYNKQQDFFHFLQNIHDTRPIESWRENLEVAAKQMNLTFPAHLWPSNDT